VYLDAWGGEPLCVGVEVDSDPTPDRNVVDEVALASPEVDDASIVGHIAGEEFVADDAPQPRLGLTLVVVKARRIQPIQFSVQVAVGFGRSDAT
jgi:hypothetical protein